MDWNEYVAGILAAAVIIPLIGYLGRFLWRVRKSAVETITLRVQISRVPREVRFGLLHVRDGGGQDDKGPLLNNERFFKRKTDAVIEARVRYQRALGCQFKCFVDHRGTDFRDVTSMLESLGYTEISRSAGRPSRAFFLIPGYQVVEAGGAIRNNFVFPA